MRWFAIISLAAAMGCGAEGTQQAPATPDDAAGPDQAPGADQTPPPAGAPTFAEQVTAGQALYTDKCASCHGASGEGGKAPKVVGLAAGALPLDPPPGSKYRTGQFKNALDVANFVVKTMPADAPASLTEAEYWAILAFDLHANGVDLPVALDANSAKGVVLHE